MAEIDIQEVTVASALDSNLVEELQQARDDQQWTYVSITGRRGLTLLTRDTVVRVPDGRLNDDGPSATATRDILRHICIPERHIEKATKRTWHKTEYFLLFWMPPEPIEITLLDSLLRRRRREWIFSCFVGTR